MKKFKKIKLLCVALACSCVSAVCVGCSLLEGLMSSTGIDEYKVIFKNYDGVTLIETSVEEGEIPTYTGATPEKASTDEYVYTFVGWDKELSAITGETTYTAVFKAEKRKYEVKFVNEDGTVLQTSNVEYGTVPSYTGEAPSKESTAEYDYVFGWDKEVVAVTGEVTYTAKFTEVKRKYEVKFVNADGSVLQSQNVEYGAIPAYTGDTPEKASTAEYDYVFAGWDKELNAVTGEVTYTATYTESTRRYEIKFVNADGTVLQTSILEYGAMPSYTEETPIKENTVEYTYTFAGWDKEIGAVVGEETYTATYTAVSTGKRYVMNWADNYASAVEFGSPIIASPSDEGWGDEGKALYMEYSGYPTMQINTPLLTNLNEKDENGDYLYNYVTFYAYTEAEGNPKVIVSGMSSDGDYYVTLKNKVWTPIIAVRSGSTFILPNGKDIFVEGAGCTADDISGWKLQLYSESYTWIKFSSIIATKESPVLPQDGADVALSSVDMLAKNPYKSELSTEKTYGNEEFSMKVSVGNAGDASWQMGAWGAITGSLVLNTPSIQDISGYKYLYFYVYTDSANLRIYGNGSDKWSHQVNVVKGEWTLVCLVRGEDGAWRYGNSNVLIGGDRATKETNISGLEAFDLYFAKDDNGGQTDVSTYGNIYVSAVRVSNELKFDVNFVDEGGNVLQSATMDYGTMPTYTGEVLSKDSTAEYDYVFGWDKTIVPVAGDITYTVKFAEVKRKYEVKFVNEDGTVLQTSQVEYGTMPVYNGETPTKENTAEYNYVFAGWDKELSVVTEAVTYTATFTGAKGVYEVKFVNDDGTVLQTSELEYGTMPVYNGETPTKESTEEYTYEFIGWDKEISAVTGAVVYTATYKANAIVQAPSTVAIMDWSTDYGASVNFNGIINRADDQGFGSETKSLYVEYSGYPTFQITAPAVTNLNVKDAEGNYAYNYITFYAYTQATGNPKLILSGFGSDGDYYVKLTSGEWTPVIAKRSGATFVLSNGKDLFAEGAGCTADDISGWKMQLYTEGYSWIKFSSIIASKESPAMPENGENVAVNVLGMSVDTPYAGAVSTANAYKGESLSMKINATLSANEGMNAWGATFAWLKFNDLSIKDISGYKYLYFYVYTDNSTLRVYGMNTEANNVNYGAQVNVYKENWTLVCLEKGDDGIWRFGGQEVLNSTSAIQDTDISGLKFALYYDAGDNGDNKDATTYGNIYVSAVRVSNELPQ